MTKKEEKQLRWKFLRENFKSEYGDFIWKIGKWEKHNGELVGCKSGFHCSKQINQAFSFVQGEILARVEVKGESLIDKNKEVWSEMRIVKTYDWVKEDSVALAIFAAEQVIGIFEKEFPDDNRPRKAIEAANEWLENPTGAAAKAARAAAAAAEAAAKAAWAAAWAAGDAAWAAGAAKDAWAAKAAMDAAMAAGAAAKAAKAAWAAAWAAGDAAWAAVRDVMIEKIENWFLDWVKEQDD